MSEKPEDHMRDAILKRMLEMRPEPRKANPYRSKKKPKKKAKK